MGELYPFSEPSEFPCGEMKDWIPPTTGEENAVCRQTDAVSAASGRQIPSAALYAILGVRTERVLRGDFPRRSRFVIRLGQSLTRFSAFLCSGGRLGSSVGD